MHTPDLLDFVAYLIAAAFGFFLGWVAGRGSRKQ